MEQEHHIAEVDPYSRSSGAIKTTQPLDMGNQSNYELSEDGYPRDLDTGGNRAKRPAKQKDKKNKEYIELQKSKPDSGNVETYNYNDIYDNTDIEKNNDK